MKSRITTCPSLFDRVFVRRKDRLCFRRFAVFGGFSLLFLLLAAPVAGEDTPAPLFITIPRTERPWTLEDLLDGASISKRAAVVKDFVQWAPQEGQPGTQQTTAYLAYDQKHLYVGFVCLDQEPEKIRAYVTQRDQIVYSNDLVGVIVDTYYDRRRGHAFLVNPYGIQGDFTFTEPGPPVEDLSFDTLWYSQGRRTSNGYVVLTILPFKSLRFSPERQQTWGIILYRSIPRNQEWSVWPAVSQKMSGWLAQEAEARGLEDISPGKNIQLNPYGFFSSTRFLDKETNQFQRERLKERLGLDAKWVLASNLTLDAMANPDFSQIESDEPQVTVNRRFEVFFPERRPFFMENSSYFKSPGPVESSSYRQEPLTLLFTRRIADPQFGLKLTGKAGPYTIAALAADDRSPGETVRPGDPSFGQRAFFNVVRFSRDIYGLSSVGLIWSAREFRQAFNRVVGFDGRLQFSKSTGVNIQALKSFSRDLAGVRKQGTAISAGLDHSGHFWRSSLEYGERSPDFEVASGFVSRLNFRSLDGSLRRVFRPEGGWLVTWQPYVEGGVLGDYRNVRQDYYGASGLMFNFVKSTSLSTDYLYKRERFGGIDFLKRLYSVELDTHRSRWLSARLYYGGGRQINFSPTEGLPPFLGQGTEVSFHVTVRPTARVLVENTLLESRLLTLDQRRAVFNNNILRSKFTYQFTPRLSLRVIGQYSNVLPSAQLSSLEYSKNFSGDVLLTYLLHPGTAVYVGYANLLENYDRRLVGLGSSLARSPRDLLSTGAGLFVKVSYLYRF